MSLGGNRDSSRSGRRRTVLRSRRQDGPLRLALLAPSLLSSLGKTGAEAGVVDGRSRLRSEFVDHDGIVKFVVVIDVNDLGWRLRLRPWLPLRRLLLLMLLWWMLVVRCL